MSRFSCAMVAWQQSNFFYLILKINKMMTFWFIIQTEIVKAYRKLAKKWHPDMHKKQVTIPFILSKEILY